MMIVWIVEIECDDSFYGMQLSAIFATEQLAKDYVASHEFYVANFMEISEYKVFESLPVKETE